MPGHAPMRGQVTTATPMLGRGWHTAMVCLAGTHTVRGLVLRGNTGLSFDTFNGQRCAFLVVGNLWLATRDANGDTTCRVPAT